MGKTISEILQLGIFKKINHGVYGELDDEERKIYREKLIRDLDNDIQTKVLMECIHQRYRQHFNRQLDEEDGSNLPLIKEINDYNEKKEKETVKSDYVFITVNPRPGVAINDFVKTVNKSVEKTFIKKSLHVIEQRGENMEELGKGFHTHILLNKGDYRMSHLRREFARTFGKVTDTSNPQWFKVDLCKPSDLANRQNYIVGRKKDPSKWLKQDMDIPFRKKFDILSEYGHRFDDEIMQIAKDGEEDIGEIIAGL